MNQFAKNPSSIFEDHQSDKLLELWTYRLLKETTKVSLAPPGAHRETDSQLVNKPVSSVEAKSFPALPCPVLPWLARTGMASCWFFGSDANQRQARAIGTKLELKTSTGHKQFWENSVSLPSAYFAPSKGTPYNSVFHENNCKSITTKDPSVLQ